MLKVSGKPLIHHLISALLKNGITNIIIVVGYRHQEIISYLKSSFPKLSFIFVFNPEYRNKENIYSLYLALPYLKGEDILLMNSDILCDIRIMKKAIDAPFNTMIIDTAAEYTAEGTKVKININGCISDIGKKLTPDQSSGEYIGIFKLLQDSKNLYFKQVTQMVQNGEIHVWSPYAFKKILPAIHIKPTLTDQLLWEEIDTPEDYESASQKAASPGFSLE